MSSAVTILVDTEGIIRLWSEDGEDIFGYSADEVIGKSMQALIPEIYRERHWKGFNKAMASGKVHHDQLVVNSPILCSDGIVKLFPGREILLRDAFGASVGVVAIFSPVCKQGEDNGLTTIYADSLTG
jgi:PAS domain S-box-containing protein